MEDTKINQKIFDHVAKFNKKEGYGEDEESVIEMIVESDVVWEGDEQSHRWWNDQFRVTEIDGMLIGYWWAVTTGDDSARDKGWDFEKESICEVVKKEETKVITTYEAVK